MLLNCRLPVMGSFAWKSIKFFLQAAIYSISGQTAQFLPAQNAPRTGGRCHLALKCAMAARDDTGALGGERCTLQ
jgi:hypothetical protein